MPKSQIIKDIANGSVLLTTTLQRSLIIAHDLKNEKLKKWIGNELYGYSNTESIPEYRKLYGNLKLSYIYGTTKVTNQTVGAAILPDEYKDANIYRCKDSISSIEQFLSNGGNATVSLVELIPFLKTKDTPYLSIFDLSLEIPSSAFKRVFDQVSKEALEILLKIEGEIGNLDGLDIMVSPKQMDEINKNINVYIDSFINIGNDNDVSNTLIAGKSIQKK